MITVVVATLFFFYISFCHCHYFLPCLQSVSIPLKYIFIHEEKRVSKKPKNGNTKLFLTMFNFLISEQGISQPCKMK